MSILKANGLKLFLGVSCLLLVLSLIFSAYSYAKYVTNSGVDTGSVGTAKIDCTFTVGKEDTGDGETNADGETGTFINAPFMQKITDTTQPVQMNAWTDTLIKVANNGPANGLSYEYSFVLYLPSDFAGNAMFQLVKLKKPVVTDYADNKARVAAAEKASEILRLDTTTLKLAPVTATQAGAEITNDYAELLTDANKTLLIETADPCAELQPEIHAMSLPTAFKTGFKVDEVEHFVTPITVTQSADLQFYRIKVYLSYSQSAAEYVLNGGDSQSFLFRLVLREALDHSVFDSVVWDPSTLWQTENNADGSVRYLAPKKNADGTDMLPAVDKDHVCKWATQENADGSQTYLFDATDGKPMLMVADKDASRWQTVSVMGCAGLTSPAKLAAVFEQCM